MSLQTDAIDAALPLGAAPSTGAPHRWVPIRTLGSRHRTRVRDHLLALNEDDRLRRFGHIASDDRIRHYAEQMDFDADEIFGIFDRRLQLVAMVHLAFAAPGELPAGTAEFGISVLPQARQRGMGALLFEHAVTLARNRGVRTMLIHMARDNKAMLAIVRRAGAGLSFDGADAVATLPLAANTLGSQIQEMLDHQSAEFDYRLKLQLLRLDVMRPGG